MIPADPESAPDNNQKFMSLVDDIFLKHPRDAGEHYFEHLWYTLKIAFMLLLCACTAILHGFVPRILQTATSDRVLALADDMRARRKEWQENALRRSPE
jgi:hypothetical protein